MNNNKIKSILKKTMLAGAMVLGFLPAWSATSNLTSYVDPLIGSGGHGHVFVGANVPFGELQVGPMNIYKGWDWCSGYHYSDSIIVGFSHTHLSGTGCSDLGDISLMPYMGRVRTSQGKQEDIFGSASSYFKHANEAVAPGFYSVKLDNGVNVELTATNHVGLHHYTYTGSDTPRLLIDLKTGIDAQSYETYIRRVDDYTVEGFRFAHGWAPFHKTFFYITFNRPIKSLEVFSDNTPQGIDELQGKEVKGVVTFADNDRDVMTKVAISSVSCKNARLNLETELPDWNFAATRKAAVNKWNKWLGIISVDGNETEKKVFYTALYHMFIAPTQYADVNGDFRGMDDKIYTGNKFCNYSTFSLWDTYRTLQPLMTILSTELVSDEVNSMLSIYDQNGKLPIWPLLSGETNCMPGYSSVPVIADAYLKGIQGFDADRALRYMVSTATNPQQNGVPELMKYGYIPADKKGEATSINLEYAADDWGLALMARKMGHEDIYNTFIKRGLSYRTLFDARINKIHPKMADGSWYEPYDPFLANHRNGVGDFTEGNGWEYTFMVPQDPEGLIAAHGGDKAFVKNLDELFVATGNLGQGAPPDVSGMVGQYAHGNEPNHHIPYLYVYAGQQWKTAARVRSLMRQFYKTTPDGYAGNEDCGQMSAWFVSSALGLYQVNPSNGVYVFGSPLFPEASIHLENGNTFKVVAKNNSDINIYIKSATLNGKPYNKSFITYSDIMKGGTLEFTMSDKPNKKFGAARACRPVSAR